MSVLDAVRYLVDLIGSLTASSAVQNSTLSQSSQGVSATTVVRVERKKTTSDAYFGNVFIGDEFQCYSMERISVAIPQGLYNAAMELSPHFGFATPHLNVPGRSYIEIHPANYPLQLEGCIAVGTQLDNDSLDNSRAAFDSLVAKLPQNFQVQVS